MKDTNPSSPTDTEIDAEFEQRLRALVNQAHEGDVAVCGGWAVENEGADNLVWNIEITAIES